MASFGSDRREGGSSGGRSQRAPIAFTGPPSSTLTQTQRARRAHPGGVITRVYPPGYDPNDRTHRFERQRSASGTPVPNDTPALAPRQAAASRVRRDSHNGRSRLQGRHDTRGHQHSFPLGLPPHLDSPGFTGIDDNSAQPMADGLDGPWPAYDPIDEDAEDDGQLGRSHALQRTPAAPRTAARGEASSAGAALDYGMATPAPAVQHGSMAADFEAGAPIAYVNEAPLRGYDAYRMQERMADQLADQQAHEFADVEAEEWEAKERAAEASRAEVAARRARAALVRADAEARMRALQEESKPAEQPLEEEDPAEEVGGYTPFRTADRSNGAQYAQRAVPASELGPRGRHSYLSQADAGRVGPRQHAPLMTGRIVIPEDWGDDDEPIADSYADEYAAPRDLAYRSTASRLSRGNAGREVHMTDGWGDDVPAGRRSGVAARIVHAPKQLDVSTSGRVVTALQTAQRPKDRPAAQPAAKRTTSHPAPAADISVEDRLNMSLDSIATRQKGPVRADAAARGRGNSGARSRGRGRLGGRHAAGRAAGDAEPGNGDAARDSSQHQQKVATEQRGNGIASGTGKRAVQAVLKPADKLNMSLDQIQKRQRV